MEREKLAYDDEYTEDDDYVDYEDVEGPPPTMPSFDLDDDGTKGELFSIAIALVSIASFLAVIYFLIQIAKWAIESAAR